MLYHKGVQDMEAYLLERTDGHFWDGLHGWCNRTDAAMTADAEEARLMADDWNSWFATKGYGYRVSVVEVELSEWNQ